MVKLCVEVIAPCSKGTWMVLLGISAMGDPTYSGVIMPGISALGDHHLRDYVET